VQVATAIGSCSTMKGDGSGRTETSKATGSTSLSLWPVKLRHQAEMVLMPSWCCRGYEGLHRSSEQRGKASPIKKQQLVQGLQSYRVIGSRD
jgi:hypothetical protein